MEALTLLRYWRSNAGDGATNANVTTSTTIVTGVSSQASETVDEEDEENDHGPFFDLEFNLPAQGDGGGVEEHEKNGETENGSNYREEDEDEEDSDESETELKFTLVSASTGSSGGDSIADVNVSVSPSDDLFFKGGFVPVDHTTETKPTPPQFRLGLMKSATKFRVMMLKFRKSKLNAESSECTESNASGSSNSKKEEKEADQNGESTDSGKPMTMKFNGEEVPIVSLFKRRNNSKPTKKQHNENESVTVSSDDKKFTKETMQRYFRKVKPLYIRVSKKYSEKLKFTGQLSFPGASKPNFAPPSTAEEQKQSPAANFKRENESTSEVSISEPPLLLSTAKGLKQGNLPAGLRVVCKHFGKTWSVSPPAAAATVGPPVTITSKRRDDSLIQQHDGIQSAILHCKRSFKASRDADCSSGDVAAPSGECETS